jgi:hypothetical protein
MLDTVFSAGSCQGITTSYNEDASPPGSQLSVEIQSVKRRLGNWREMTASLGDSLLKHGESCKEICEEKTLVDAAEEPPPLEALTRKRVIMRQQTEKLSVHYSDL